MNARLALSLPLLLLATVAAAFAPAPVYKEPPKRAAPPLQQAMQGTWGTAGHTPRVRIVGKTWTLLSPAVRRAAARGGLDVAYEMHLDATRDPVALDLKIEGTTRVLMRGIVKMEGDRLIFCYARSGTEEDRPKAFTDAPTGRVRIMTLSRVESPAPSP